MPDHLAFLTRVLRRDNFLYAYLLDTVSRYTHPGQRVLDAGCGVGPLSLFLAHRGCRVVGVDLSPQAVAACQHSARHLGLEEQASFQVADLGSLDVAGPFDLILCSEALEHVPDDLGVLVRFRQLLAANGTLLVTTPSPRAPIHRLRLLLTGKDRFDEQSGHLRRYTTRQLSDLLARAGFRVEHAERTEGLLRSLLALTAPGRFFIRLVRLGLTPTLIAIDRATARLFGEAQIIIVARAAAKEG